MVKINGENKVVVCEEDAAIVRRIFEESLSGKVPAKIAEGLATDGIRNRSGKFFIERNITIFTIETLDSPLSISCFVYITEGGDKILQNLQN